MKIIPPKKLKEIAALIKAEYVGDGEQLITGINEIHRVEPGDITFVDHPKYYDKALNSAASTIIIDKRVKCPENKSLIFSDDPFSAFTSLIKHFHPFEPCNKYISDTAVIGKNTIIQPGTFIGNHVKIGDNCIIHANVTIYDHTEIGNNVIIHSGTVIGADAFYFKRRPNGWDKLISCGKVIIEDNVEIGANCTIDRGVSSNTIIGRGTIMDNLIQVGHDTVIGKNCLICSQVGIAGVVTIEDDVVIWGQVGIQKDLRIGKGAVILAKSGVAKSIEGGKTYFGSPVQEAKSKMKEIAFIKQLPSIIAEIKNKIK